MIKPQEGELFKIITLGGKSFEIKYGYYEDYERNMGDPIPIYPDFIKAPCYEMTTAHSSHRCRILASTRIASTATASASNVSIFATAKT